MNWSFAGDIQSRMELFDRELQRYETRARESVSLNLRVGMVLNGLDRGPLTDHLLLNRAKYLTWQEFKSEIVGGRRKRSRTVVELPPWMLEHSRKVTKVVVAVLARARRTRHAITVGDEVISRKIARNLVEEHTGRILVPRPNPNRKERAKVGKVKPETERLSMLLRTTTRRSTMMRKSKNSQRMRKDWVRVGSKGETVIDIGIDSCAAASVIPRGLLQLPVRRDGRGDTYYTAALPHP